MYRNIKIVKVDYKYCDYLRTFDSRVSYNAGKKELRPFVGILFVINKCEYFAPLASPKAKHVILKNTLDLLKIDNGKLGVVNLNNMIPVMPNNYIVFDLNKKTTDVNEMFRINLLSKQLRWLTSNKKEVLLKSRLLYNLYINNKLQSNVKKRCCDFVLLEAKCKNYKSN